MKNIIYHIFDLCDVGMKGRVDWAGYACSDNAGSCMADRHSGSPSGSHLAQQIGTAVRPAGRTLGRYSGGAPRGQGGAWGGKCVGIGLRLVEGFGHIRGGHIRGRGEGVCLRVHIRGRRLGVSGGALEGGGGAKPPVWSRVG